MAGVLRSCSRQWQVDGQVPQLPGGLTAWPGCIYARAKDPLPRLGRERQAPSQLIKAWGQVVTGAPGYKSLCMPLVLCMVSPTLFPPRTPNYKYREAT